jgi:hypothetical protein
MLTSSRAFGLAGVVHCQGIPLLVTPLAGGDCGRSPWPIFFCQEPALADGGLAFRLSPFLPLCLVCSITHSNTNRTAFALSKIRFNSAQGLDSLALDCCIYSSACETPLRTANQRIPQNLTGTAYITTLRLVHIVLNIAIQTCLGELIDYTMDSVPGQVSPKFRTQSVCTPRSALNQTVIVTIDVNHVLSIVYLHDE